MADFKSTMKNIVQNTADFFKGCKSDVDSKGGNTFLLVAIIILINIAGALFFFRADLTLNDSYSLSPVSVETVKSLEEPVIVKVFFSENLPAQYSSVRRYLVDLLDEYSFTGGRNFRYDLVDMTGDEGRAEVESYGIAPIQVQEMANDQFNARSAYMGLVIIHGDLIEKINQVAQDEGLEYRITSLIKKMAGKSNALLKLSNKIKVTLYVSSALSNFGIAGFSELDQTVNKTFEKVNTLNFSKLEYAKVDPSADKDALKLINEVSAKYGLQKISWKVQQTREGKTIPAGDGLFGVVVESGNSFKALPFGISFNPFQGYQIAGLNDLEDRINDAVSAVLSQNPVIGYVTGHGEKDINAQPQQQQQQEGAASLGKLLKASYEVKEVDLTKENIPDNVKTLIVNGPKSKIADEDLYKIDQYLMHGGNVIFLVDSFSEMRMQQNNPYAQSFFMPIDTGLEKIVAPMGVTVGKDYVLDERCYIARQQGQQDMPIYFAPIIERSSLNHDNPISEYLKQIIMLKVSSISINNDTVKKAGLTATTLVSSSKKSWKMEGQINLNPMMIAPPDEKTLAQFPLAVLIEGSFTSAFNGVKPAPAVEDKDKNKVKKETTEPLIENAGLAKSTKNGKIFIAGSSELTSDQIIDPDGKAPSSVFMLNIIDYLNGDISTPEMRSKGIGFNPIDTTSPTGHLLVKGINIVIVPLLAVIIGLIVWRRRISRRNAIKTRYAQGVSHE